MFSWMNRKRPQTTAGARKRRVEARPSVDALEERVVLDGAGTGTGLGFFGNEGVVGGRVIDNGPSTGTGTGFSGNQNNVVGGRVIDNGTGGSNVSAASLSARLSARAAAERSISGGQSASAVALRNFNDFNNRVNQLTRQYTQQANRYNQLVANQANMMSRQLNSQLGGLARQFERNLGRNGQGMIVDTSLIQQRLVNQQQQFVQRLNGQFGGFQQQFRNQLTQLGNQATTFGTPFASAFQNFQTSFDTGLGFFGNENVRSNLQVIDRTFGDGLTNFNTLFNNAAANPTDANAFRTSFNTLSTDFGRTLGSSVNGFSQTLTSGLTTLNSSNNTSFSNFYSDLDRFYFTPGSVNGGSGGAGSGSGLPGGGTGTGVNTNPNTLPGTTINPGVTGQTPSGWIWFGGGQQQR